MVPKHGHILHMTQHPAKGWYSRGYLPHFDSPETIQHVVFRTFGSLPPPAMDALPAGAAARRNAIDAHLDRLEAGNVLAEPAVAEIVESVMFHFDGVRYGLLAWCVMPNHVHAVIQQRDGWPLGSVVKSWKVASTRQFNMQRGTAGSLWALDFYDRFMRDENHLAQTLGYVEANPVRAGLARVASDWRFSSARQRARPL